MLCLNRGSLFIRHTGRSDLERCSSCEDALSLVSCVTLLRSCWVVCAFVRRQLMSAQARVTAAFRKLVALVARAFYAGECPPKTAEELAAPTSGRSRQQVEHNQGLLSDLCSACRLRADCPFITYTGHDTWFGNSPLRCPMC